MQTSAPSTSALAHTFRERLKGFLAPLLARLDEQLDSRLVRTLGAIVEVLLQNRFHGSRLLLSELGAFLTSPEKAAAAPQTARGFNCERHPRGVPSVSAEGGPCDVVAAISIAPDGNSRLPQFRSPSTATSRDLSGRPL